jgi:uncharacterized protein YecE (DUF72 family)
LSFYTVVIKNVLIGCSGYYYSHWRNNFYPDSLSSAQWLAYYSTVFNTVELNAPFYRVPQVAALKRYAAQTPSDFKFAVKVHKQITHGQKLKDSGKLIDDFFKRVEEGLAQKLGTILFQLPPSFSFNEENMERIAVYIPSDPRIAIEFRNKTWWNDEVLELLKSKQLNFCNTDYTGLQQTFTLTGDTFYARMHGATQLFKSEYTENQLRSFCEMIPSASKICVYFNNTYYDAAIKNALFLKKILGGD